MYYLWLIGLATNDAFRNPVERSMGCSFFQSHSIGIVGDVLKKTGKMVETIFQAKYLIYTYCIKEQTANENAFSSSQKIWCNSVCHTQPCSLIMKSQQWKQFSIKNLELFLEFPSHSVDIFKSYCHLCLLTLTNERY